MDESMVELGRRAVACSGFRWAPGMLAVSPANPGGRWYRISLVAPDGMAGIEEMAAWPGTWGCEGHDGLGPMDPAEWIPRLSDSATLGCVEHLVREAWASRGGVVHVRPPHHPEPPTEDLWEVIVFDRDGIYSLAQVAGVTQAEALVAALEAVGRRA